MRDMFSLSFVLSMPPDSANVDALRTRPAPQTDMITAETL